MPIVRIQNLNNPKAPLNHFQGEVRLRFLINSGSLLFAWSGTPGTSFGAHIWNGGPAVLNQHIFHVVFDEQKIDKQFFLLAINQKLDELIEKAHGGVGLRHVTKGKFEATEIDIPPLEDQRLIVYKLGGLLSRTLSAQTELDRVPKLMERYKQAVLGAAFRGDWPNVSLSTVCDSRRVITYGVIKLGSTIKDGVPCLRTSNVRWLRFKLDNVKCISAELSSEYSRTILRGGEVLVNVRGTLGGVAVVDSSMAGWNVSREVAVIPVDQSLLDPSYVAYWIGSTASQDWLTRVEKGVAYTGINIEDLRKLPIPCPPLSEQRRIVYGIEKAFAKIRNLASETERAAALLPRLESAALSRAFRGELI